MFWKKEREIKKQVEEYLQWREKRGFSSFEDEQFLEMFIEITGAESVSDITIDHMRSWLEAVGERYGNWLYRRTALQAVYSMLRYYKARKYIVITKEIVEKRLD